ncbi:unnamed protein product [Ectocarpus sp. CCAP 1310/34]|nr:unnamed protein product [Ectocarpus sp. CCAP 1310/34]
MVRAQATWYVYGRAVELPVRGCWQYRTAGYHGVVARDVCHRVCVRHHLGYLPPELRVYSGYS